MPEPTSSAARPPFNAYALPLPRRREGPAAALSFLAHVTIAVLVLWRGAALVAGGGGGGSGPRGGGGGGGRPAVRWFALPAPSVAQATEIPAVLHRPSPCRSRCTLEPVTIEPPLPAVAVAAPAVVGTGAGPPVVPAKVLAREAGRGRGPERASAPIPVLARAATRVTFSPPRRAGRFSRLRARHAKRAAGGTRSGSGSRRKDASPGSR
jgi:hypothetical protein